MDRRAFAALALVALGGCVIAPLPPADEPYAPEQGPEVESAPPPPQAETPPPMPGAGYIWIGGWWRWHLGRHVWVAGRWARPPAGHALGARALDAHATRLALDRRPLLRRHR